MAADAIIGAVELIFGGSAANAPRLKGDLTYHRQPLHEQAFKIGVALAPVPGAKGAKPMARGLGLAFPGARVALQAAVKKGAPELKVTVKEGAPVVLKALKVAIKEGKPAALKAAIGKGVPEGLKATVKEGAPAALKAAVHKGAPMALQGAIKKLVGWAGGKVP